MAPSYTLSFRNAPDWDSLPIMEAQHCGWTPESGIRAFARAFYDGEALHIRMEAVEPELRATFTGLLDHVCEDSCLEFFFAPRTDDPRYFNFEWNPLGALDLSFGYGRPNRVRQVAKDCQTLFHPAPFRTETGWGIDFSIPLAFLRIYFPDYAFSGQAAGNFYKCGDKTVQPHFLAWSPLRSQTPDFHRREDFGLLSYETAL